jgi:hypothetical protein
MSQKVYRIEEVRTGMGLEERMKQIDWERKNKP